MMIKRILPVILILSGVLCSADIISQTPSEAVAYMSQISEQNESIQKETWDYISTSARGRSARKVEKKRLTLLKTIHKAIQHIKSLPEFDNDASLRDSVVSFLSLDFIVLNEDYSKIVDMEEIAEQSYDAMEAYILAKEIASDKLEKAFENLESQYESFAAKYEITLVKNTDKISIKLKQASDALSYYNKVYLVFFKANKQEYYMLDALERNDINAIEQNRNALQSIAVEGLEKLTEISHYKGNSSINSSCKKMLMFYQDEAKAKIPILTDFLQVVDEYNKMVALYKSKDRMLLTNEEITQYNQAVEKYNKGISKYQSTNNSLNNKRKMNLEAWQRSVSTFMERYVSKN